MIALLAICHGRTLEGMFNQWMSGGDMGHALVALFVMLFILWRELQTVADIESAAERRGSRLVDYLR